MGTSCCNLLDPICSEEESESEEEKEVADTQERRLAKLSGGAVAEPDSLSAWLGVSWLIMYLMFILFLLYKRKPGPVH